MQEKRIPIRQKLFRTYTLLYGLIFLVMLAIFSWIASTDIQRKIVATQRQMMNNITVNIEGSFAAMDDLSMRLITDVSFKQLALKSMPDAFENKTNQTTSFQKLYLSCRDMFINAYQIGIYNRAGYYTWLGGGYYINALAPNTVDQFVDYKDTGIIHIERRAENPFLRASMPNQIFADELRESICLWRTMSAGNRFGNAQAVLEIYMRYDEFAKKLQRLCNQSSIEGLGMAVLDSHGKALFNEDQLTLPATLETGERNVHGELLTLNYLDNYGLYVYYRIPVGSNYSGLRWFVILISILGIGFFAVILLTTYRTSNVLSRPIAELCEQVKSLGRNVPPQKVATSMIELNFLAETIYDLRKNLDQSIDEVVSLRTEETNAKMLALQAQMQPHFLHNALTTIAAMAVERGNAEIAEMCASLTNMLRYITAEQSGGVPLYEEIAHLDHYAQIMKIRFPAAQVEHSIPLDMLTLIVPKLSVQPIVENSFKYADNGALTVRVTGFVTPTGWRICITDNGQGFAQSTIAEIHRRSEELLHNPKAPAATINGMGLVNIYLRLRLFYKERMIFRLENTESGACVTIGCEDQSDG